MNQKEKTTDILSERWSTRNTLNQSEWGELYQIIWKILITYHPSELKGQARHATSRNSGTPVALIRSPTQRMGDALNALRP